MLVLGAVPTLQFHRLRRAAAPRFPVTHALTWDVALATIRTRPVELAVVDPQLQGPPPSAQEIGRLRLLFPSLPLVPYPALPPPTPPLPPALGPTRLTRPVSTPLDDHP